MNDKINDGGPAFPFTPNQQMQLADGTWDQNTEFGEPGMSLRDWFAGMALSGLNPFQPNEDGIIHIAQRCYAIADAMITERDKQLTNQEEPTK